jgi:hypothetical protein
MSAQSAQLQELMRFFQVAAGGRPATFGGSSARGVANSLRSTVVSSIPTQTGRSPIHAAAREAGFDGEFDRF